MWKTPVGVLALVVLSAMPGKAASPADLCSRLVAEPGSTSSRAGAALEATAAEASIAACGAALEADPADPRLTYRYAVALESAGRLDDARRLYGWAAEADYPPAVAALDRVAKAGDSRQQGEPRTEDAARTSALLAGASAVLRRYAASLPADPGDPLTILAEIGSDPETIFQWVSENTRLVAYRGTLRGARGVLLDRSGNSLDRSLLLAMLLSRSGEEVRLARAPLSEEQARALLPGTERAPATPAAAASSRDTVMALLKAEPRFDQAFVAQVEERTTKQAEELAGLLATRSALLLPAIRAQVARFAETADRAAEAADLAALRDHFWVQMRISAGWRDLDPEAAALGPIAAQETLEATEIPENLRHAVTLRIVIELEDASGRREETLLTWDGYPAELFDRPISFFHIPRLLGAVAQSAGSPDYPQRFLKALDDESTWIPAFLVGDELVTERQFTKDGKVTEANLSALAATGGEVAARLDQIDDLFGDDAGGEPAPGPATPTAEWIEVEIRVPGLDPIVERRTIFDLPGPAVRAAGLRFVPTADQLRDRAFHLLGKTEVLISGASLTKLMVDRITSRELPIFTDGLRTVLATPASVDLTEAPPSPRLPYALYRFASRRLAAAGNAGASLAMPNIVMQHLRYSWQSNQTVVEEIEIDVLQNHVWVPRGGFSVRVGQGVVDTIVENLLLDDETASKNAAKFHAEDLAAGVPWVLLDPGNKSLLEAPSVPPDFRFRVEAELAAGGLVIVPPDLPAAASQGRLAWWRIDPSSGTALGMLPGGGGATAVETAYKYVNIASCAFSAFTVVSEMMAKRITADGVVSAVSTGACLAGGIAGKVLRDVPNSKPLLLIVDALGMAIDAVGQALP